jgi:tetraacyldisaccharide 4'-kinase
MILMRGYKGKLENSSGIVERGKRLGVNPADFGDEALLLSRRSKSASVVVGKNRSDNLNFYFEKEKPDIVVLDDGHQHLKLSRCLDIVLFDALMPLSRYKVAPLGYMREGLSALKDADVVVIGRADQVERSTLSELKKFLQPHMSVKSLLCEVRYVPTGLYDSRYQVRFYKDQIQGLKVYCVAGIASPHSFFHLVDSLGAEVMGTEAFPDHHYFETDEMERILERAARLDAVVVTTEKDIVKMRRVVDDEKLLYLEIQVDFLKGEQEFKEIVSKTFLDAY